MSFLQMKTGEGCLIALRDISAGGWQCYPVTVRRKEEKKKKEKKKKIVHRIE